MLGLFRKKDPVCGMKEQEGKGLHKEGNWFCSPACTKKYGQQSGKSARHASCCGH